MKSKTIRSLLFSIAMLFAVCSHAAESKLKILLVTGVHAFETNAFFQVFSNNPAIDFTPAFQGPTNAPVFDRPDLLTYDVVVLYDMPKTITEEQKAKFKGLFDKGIGLVVLHHALCSYQDWPEYEKLIGGRYLEAPEKSGDTIVTPASHFEHDHEVPIVILAKDHPITAGMTNFVIHDEIYWGFRTQPDVTPLLTTTEPKSGKPLMWVRTQGKSRVVYLQLGHDHQAYNDPNYQELVARSIRWAAH